MGNRNVYIAANAVNKVKPWLKHATHWTIVCVAFIAFAVSAVAQLSGRGAIKGIVADQTGAAIPNATVIATSTTRGTKVTVLSNGAGQFTVSPLDADIYTLTVSASGFQTVTQQDVHVNSLEIADVPIAMNVGSSEETVTVTAAPPALETSNATLGATMENDVYSALPIEMGAYGSPDQRRATDFAFLMPGVQGNNTQGNPTTNTGIVNGSGSRGAVSVVYIDGLPFVRAGGNGDPRFVWTAISVDAVDQFQVQTSGYSAIYEGQGIQNYTIKAGGNQYHGSLYYFLRNTALDTWGFYGKAPGPTGKPVKPVEHSNEFGINLSGPLIPFGTWKEKIFFFGNYNGFRYSASTPTAITFPTSAQQQGDFSAAGLQPIYDPFTQQACTANSTDGPCRYQFGYIHGTGTGPRGNPTLGPLGAAGVNKITQSEWAPVAVNMQNLLTTLNINPSTALQNNYISPNFGSLNNWSTTDRIDFTISPRNTVTMIAAIGRQASSNPTSQTTAGRNVGPVPFNYGQTFAPKTAVGIIEDTFVINSHMVNQFKYGYARYNGPTFYAGQQSRYAATAMGFSGLPVGAGQQGFPFVNFSNSCGSPTANAPTCWGGATPNVTIAQNYTVLDNLQWVKGNHTLTFGGQIAWMLYNVNNATGGSSPLNMTFAVTETAGLQPAANNNTFTVTSGTGQSYASFLLGQVDHGGLTGSSANAIFNQYLQQIFGTRYRAVSPYIQDNWKITSKLTLDIGLRYDFFPSLNEVHNAGSFFNPALTNPVTNLPGALQYTGNGTTTCNCASPAHNFYKNFGPRIGVAYQLDSKTVVRASYGVMFTHGNAVGGSSTTSLGTLGFSAAPTFVVSGQQQSTLNLASSAFGGTNGAIPAYPIPCGAATGPAFGTGNTNVASYTIPGCGGAASYTGAPSAMGYADPYLGGRAPEYINYTLGFQHQWTNSFTSSITYVGSQGHFLPTDGGNPRGFWSDQLDPKYLSLGSNLSQANAGLTTYCNVTNPGVCPSSLSVYNTGQGLAQLLKPFPFHGVTDTFAYVANSNYNSLQVSLNMRASHGLTFMANYTWSRAIDDGGTFRTGYAIPAAFTMSGKAWAQDRVERSVSTSNQPQHLVVTGVWALPIGQTVLANSSWERAIFGGFKLSEIFQAFSGSPLAITGNTCATNPAGSTCAPTINPNFTGGSARQNGKWGKGATYSSSPSYIVPSTGTCTGTNATAPSGPFINPVSTCLNQPAYIPSYKFSDVARTAPYNLYGPGNFGLDLALVRSFPLHLTEASRFEFRAEWYNVTNHTKFNVASAAVGNSSFGQVTTDPTAARKAWQFSGRIAF